MKEVLEMSQLPALGIIILAAGKGTRMNSELPKVLVQANGRSMLDYVIDVSKKMAPEKLCVVVGYKADMVQQAFSQDKNLLWVTQEPLLGTGHAVQFAKDVLIDFEGDILILYGDVPGITSKSLSAMLSQHRESKANITLMTAEMDNPTGYGRILKDSSGVVVAIKEEKDASQAEKKIKEVNTGIGLFDAKFLMKSVFELSRSNEQKEYYLTDVVEMAASKGMQIQTFVLDDSFEAFGVNDVSALKKMEEILKKR